tara:strand:- start:2583 stop:3143 length:561 start_codon:yes stop_codon:yes gene_type:complete
MTSSLTEAQSYTVEARRSEELASRLEDQATWYESNSAAGSLNLSQAYREWGMAEMETNRDYYGNARFDDVNFQLSAEGQELQTRFVSGYADRLHDDIEDKLTLPEFAPVQKPGVSSAAGVRGGVSLGRGGSASVGDVPDVGRIRDEVADAQARGRKRVGTVKGAMDKKTGKARGASAEAADDIKEW